MRVGHQIVAADAADLKNLLPTVYAAHDRPLCLCREPGIAMYVAKVGGRLILKRMPGTGPHHDPGCDSYEPPYELSGFGHVAGGAIQENIDDGVTMLRVDFSLTKIGRRPAAAAAEASDGGEAGSVATDGSKLSLRALLHYLWDQAEFNRWRPGMAGKRNWGVIRKFLLEAADGKMAKGKPFFEFLYVPEMFNIDREVEIAQRRLAFMSRIARAEGSKRSLLMLIGEVKEIAPARFGHRILIKHAPKFPFMLNDDVHRRMSKRFAPELALWNATPDSRLVTIATFGLDPTGVASIDTIALMVVTENWVPFEHSYDAMLLDALFRRRVSFLKGLRYDLPTDRPLASIILREDGAAPAVMYIVPPDAEDAYRHALEALIAQSDMRSWTWEARDGEMPPLPI